MDCGSTILIFLAFIQATCAQTVTVTGPSAIERGRDTAFTCTGGASPYVFIWTDTSVTPNVIIFTAGEVTYDAGDTKYLNFRISEDLGAGTSTMRIENTQIEDEGQYTCREGQESDGSALTVEVQYNTLELSVTSPLVAGKMYNATCEALNGRPDLLVTWMLGDSGSPCTPVVTPLAADQQGLFSKRSVCTFQADSTNDGETLRCMISGHQADGLGRENMTTLVIHNAPGNDIITVYLQPRDSSLRVSCNITDENQPNPRITDYYIISNGTMIHQPDEGNNFVDVELPDFVTDFLCWAGNYLGNTTSEKTYDPSRPTTLPTPTEPITTEGPTTVPPTEGTPISPSTTDGGDLPTTTPRPKGPSAAAIGGGVAGAIVVIIIVIVIIYFVKREKPGSNPPPRKNQSAVGTSNGSEKNDVAAPLNSVNEVVTEDKIKPVAAPRDQGSIQHTTDNPGQAEYAMVDRKKPGGGDMPDTRGPGQKEPQGMLYADLDLSASAGHTEKKVPQNKDDVVVYSSILV